MRAAVDRLLGWTVWHREAVPPEDFKYRGVRRFWVPLLGLLAIAGGLSAGRYGVPAINEFFTTTTLALFSAGLIASGGAMLIGVVFPKLSVIEFAGELGFVFLITGYTIALVVLTSAGEDSRGFVTVIALYALCSVLMRLSILSGEWAENRAVRQVLDRFRKS